MIPAFLALSLLVHPVLEHAEPLRLLASPNAGTVEWSVDGVPVGESHPGQAIHFDADAGTHWIEAKARPTGNWSILVRPDPLGVEGAAWVPAWTAFSQESTVFAGEHPSRAAGL